MDSDIAIRWVGHQWIAYNVGRTTTYSSKFWSTGIGDIEFDEVLTLFRRYASVMFLPP